MTKGTERFLERINKLYEQVKSNYNYDINYKKGYLEVLDCFILSTRELGTIDKKELLSDLPNYAIQLDREQNRKDFDKGRVAYRNGKFQATYMLLDLVLKM